MKQLTIIFLVLISYSGFSQDGPVDKIIDEAYELFESNDYNGAVGLLNRAINEMPDTSRLYTSRGVMMYYLKRFDEAVKDYTLALERTDIPKERAVIYSNRSNAKTTDLEGAYADLMLSIEADSTNINAMNNLSIVCGRLDRTDESLKYLKDIVRIHEDYLPGFINLGFTYQRREEHKVAVEYFNKAVKLDPNAPLAYSNRSYSRLKLGDIKGAYKDIEKSLKIYPGNSYAYKIRAMIHIEEGKKDEACADLDNAEQLKYTEEYGNEVLELKAEHCKK